MAKIKVTALVNEEGEKVFEDELESNSILLSLFNMKKTYNINDKDSSNAYFQLLKDIAQEQECWLNKTEDQKEELQSLKQARLNCSVFNEYMNFSRAIADYQYNITHSEETWRELKVLYNLLEEPWSLLIQKYDITTPRNISIVIS